MTEQPKPGPRAKRHLRVVPTDAPKRGKTPKGRTPEPTAGATEPMMATDPAFKAARGGHKARSAADPITGLTLKQEAFCQGVMSGLSLSDAYRQAYITDGMLPATVHSRACTLMQDGKVRARCEAIAGERERERRMLASSDASMALQVLRELALKADSDSARIRAAELLAKAGGVFVDKVEVEDKTPTSSVDLERRIADRLARLGIASAS